MKLYFLFSIFLVVLNTTFEKNIQYLNRRDEGINLKNETSNECQYINSILKKNESYNCCQYNGITCENGHITKINLANKGLNGPIPNTIKYLTQLKEL
ncbi:hypothetical protein PIROE2DRAFT_6275 [Piromyces sp. E2]|nr:hypothetical protein PIROE2DRAFT_6275 [Piromyces sp. E2]|eukprot:OUM66442.1 hypothetical protein PIROE2DRAFT_6275 [Piromyces sp. E2]